MNDTYLRFRPWIVKRTTLHEYVSRSWGMFDAAEYTSQSGVAAMLTGLSFELAIKALLVLVGREPDPTHKIAECLDLIPELRDLLQRLWGADLEFVVQLIDEDINSSQMRYGSAGSHKDESTKLIAAATAHDAKTWTLEVTELYEELMQSIGAAIWENYPKGDRSGQEIRRRFEVEPVFSSGTPHDAYPGLNSSVFGLLLLAERHGVETEYGAIIPIDGRRKDGTYRVRVRIDRDTAVDQEVVQQGGRSTLTGFRWIGRPAEGVQLKLYEARSTLPDVRPQTRS